MPIFELPDNMRRPRVMRLPTGGKIPVGSSSRSCRDFSVIVNGVLD